MAACPIRSSTDFRLRRTAGTLTLGDCRGPRAGPRRSARAGRLTTGAMSSRQRLALLAAGRVGLGRLLVVVASRRGPD
jgi:hypothetical protein